MIEAFEFPPPRDAAAAWRSFKLNVDQSPLMFTLWIWLPLTARTLSLLGQLIGEASDSSLFCLRTRWLSDRAVSLVVPAACARADQKA